MNRYKKLFLTIGCLMLILIACNKENIKSEFDIKGKWVQVTDSEEKISVEFKEDNDMLLSYGNGLSVELKYRFSKTDELELFPPNQYPLGMSTKHRFEYSDSTRELSIYQLIPSNKEIPEAIVFIRE